MCVKIIRQKIILWIGFVVNRNYEITAYADSPRASRRRGSLVHDQLRTTIVPDVMSGAGYIYNHVSDWSDHFPAANGTEQSPVDLNSAAAVHDPALAARPLHFRYDTCRELDICNNGQTVVVYMGYRTGESIRIENARSFVTGGPLLTGSQFELAEMRFHWGRDDAKGSEHTVNGMAYPMELHLIHYNSTLYRSLEEALGQPDGVAIVAIFVQVAREHSGMKLITDHLEDVSYKGRQKTISASFNPSCLLPDESLRDYWTYPGSLTVPPCYERVTWLLLRYPLTISHMQVEEFRRLRTHYKGEAPQLGDEGALVDNFRPVQPLNHRTMAASFQ